MHDDLDQLIDGALAQYANPEPLAGLDQRVIRRVRADRLRRRELWWLALVPAAAAILLAIVARPKPVPIAKLAIESPAPSAPSVVAPVAAAHHTPRRAARPASTTPKRSTFPTISPLTDQERMLLRLAQSHPEQLLYRPPDEIEVKPIEIAPLQIDGSQ